MKKITSIAVSLILVLVVGSMLASDLYVPEIVDEQQRPLAIVRRFKPTVELASIERETFELNLEEVSYYYLHEIENEIKNFSMFNLYQYTIVYFNLNLLFFRNLKNYLKYR